MKAAIVILCFGLLLATALSLPYDNSAQIQVQPQVQDKSANYLKNQQTLSSTQGSLITLGLEPSSSTSENPQQFDKTVPCSNDVSLPNKTKDCTREYKPICGSDMQNYNNQCEFENAQMKNPSLTMTRSGSC